MAREADKMPASRPRAGPLRRIGGMEAFSSQSMSFQLEEYGIFQMK